MVEARDLIGTWKDYPPVFLSLKGLIEGLSGKSQVVSESVSSFDYNAALTEIAAKAGRALPVLRSPDPELSKMALVVDFEEMKRRNIARSRGLRLTTESAKK
jgi:hypothetical protein